MSKHGKKMRIKIQLKSDENIYLPVNYNHHIQAFIYNYLGDDATWLHDEGYKYENRIFKLFCFSAILQKGRIIKSKGVFKFPKKISLIVTSPKQWILQDLSSNLISKEKVELWRNVLDIEAISVFKKDDFDNKTIKVKALSPIEIHSTFPSQLGKRKTYYYSPFEDEFSPLINQNMKKKWYANYKQDCEYDISIKPFFKDRDKETIINYGPEDDQFVVKAWKGEYLLNGDPVILQFALDAGLGGKNSQGFGCIEHIN